MVWVIRIKKTDGTSFDYGTFEAKVQAAGMAFEWRKLQHVKSATPKEVPDTGSGGSEKESTGGSKK